MKFRKKPVVIEAEKFNPYSREQTEKYKIYWSEHWKKHLIPTLEGDHIVQPDDWIITGVRGEFYPCKPDIFEATYEPEKESPK